MLRPLALLALASATLAAQDPGPVARNQVAVRGARAAVHGYVYDSIGKTMLVGAAVQLISAGDSAERRFAATSDSAGAYRIDDLLPGSYVAGFYHQMLDSLGLESGLRAVVIRPADQRLDLGTPSPETIARSLCGPRDSSGLLIGHVRSSDSEGPLEGASVKVIWSEMILNDLGMKQFERRITAKTSNAGWFGMCEVPGDVAVLVRAVHGTDSSGFVPVEVPPRGLKYISLYVGGSARVEVTSPDPTTPDDTSRTVAVMAMRGRARLSGVVRTDEGKVVANAYVLVAGTGLESQTNDRGAFTMDSLPGGTHTVEVRALGYLPVQSVVHLAEQRPATVQISLGERSVVLSAVQVRGTTVYSRLHGNRLAGFYERQRSATHGAGRGHFFTPEEIEARRPSVVTQLLETLPIVHVLHGRNRMMDQVLGSRNCQMTVFLDGVRIIGTLTGRGDGFINELISPNTVAGMEVYPDGMSAPAQFRSVDGRCGSVVIWTK